MSDLFGLQREQTINNSGIREVFTPHRPVQTGNLFLGRQPEVQSLVEQLNTPGQHALLFGERGVGKSSLANVASEVLLKILAGGRLIKKRCDSTDTFLSIITPILHEVGIDLQVVSSQSSTTNEGSAGLKIPVAKAEVEHAKTDTQTTAGYDTLAQSPSWVASKILHLNGLVLIDEVDALEDEADKKKLAELVKQLSDENSSLKLLMIGIADTAAELTAGHPSVHRCLKETKLGRMSDDELRQIIKTGQDKAGLTFSEQATRKIVSVSAGYPHFTHLLALKAAEDAVSEDRTQINVSHVVRATSRAVGDAEGTLKKAYDQAIRSASTDQYRRILLAASLCSEQGFPASALRESYETIWGEPISQGTLNNHFGRLIGDSDEYLLRRLGKGIYRFSDPRMPSYIQIANLEDLEHTD